MPNQLIHALFLCLLITTQFAIADDLFPAANSNENTSSSLINNSNSLGQTVEFLPVEDAYQLYPIKDGQQLLLNWEIQPGYYLYQHRFKFFDQSGNPLNSSHPNVIPKFKLGTLMYDDYYQKDLEVYYHQTQITLPLNIDGQTLIIESQGCADAGLCFPPRRQTITLNTNTSAFTVTETVNDLTATNEENLEQDQNPPPLNSLPLMLIFALLGGVILNLMPCVFPILSIKALSLTTAHLNKQGKHLHGLAYTLGIVFSFMTIASLLILLRGAGEAIGWGFQLQSPLFVGLLVYLFVLMGLSFSGFLTIGTRLMNWGQSTTEGHSLTSSFMTGLLATVVASPCTAPFMGTALGFALTQPTWAAMSTFVFLGIGMALPLLLLSWWPGMAEKMPKPGAWMERFKEFLAFPLYLSAAWLLWVLGRQTGSDTVSAVICGIVLILFSIWLLKVRKNSLTIAIAITTVTLALLLPWQTNRNHDNQDAPWQPYSEAALQELRSNGHAVFINLTADWCITCLANEKLALSSEKFLATLKEQNITYLKGDWTNYNPEITQLLNRHHRSGVPLYLFYPEGTGQPMILPQLLTENIVITKIYQHNSRK
ncbi:MAG: protein-disulfide reductase DsbD [Porticoccus sp.]|nr:protein-disulfide reductase DsbD [Porticoccus sp.]